MRTHLFFVALLAVHPINAPDTLLKSCRIPGKVMVDDSAHSRQVDPQSRLPCMYKEYPVPEVS